VRTHFDDAWVSGHDHFIGAVQLPDPDGRHVAAAAIHTNARYIVTDNLKHFPTGHLAPLGIELVSADEMLASLLERQTPDALEIIRDQRTTLRTRPSLPAYLENLTARGLPLLAAGLNPHHNVLATR